MARRAVSPQTFVKLTLASLASLSLIIVTGAAVRLTDSGLGCTDWPNCEEGQFVAPLEFHAWVEFGNRLITGVVAVAVIATVWGAYRRAPRRDDLVWLSWGLVAGVIAQILLGAVVVKTHLVPAAVSAHFLLSIALLWDAVVLLKRATEPDGALRRLVEPVVLGLSRAMLAVLVLVLFLGTFVTGSGPHSGDPGEVDRLSLDIGEIARLHGISVVVLVGLTLATLVAARRTRAPASVLRRGWVLIGALVIQAGIGYIQYFNGVPALLVGTHVAGATIVFIAALWFHLGLSTRTPAGANHAVDANDGAGAASTASLSRA